LGFLSFALVSSVCGAALAQDDSTAAPSSPPTSTSDSPSTSTSTDTSTQSTQSTDSKPAAKDEGEPDEKKKSSGRGHEWVWLNAEAGVSYINMEQFNSQKLGLTSTTAGGGMFGAGAGIRLFIFTLGVRGRLHELSTFNLWQVDGEVGLHIPLGPFEPYLSVHAGYSFVGTLNGADFSSPALPGSSTPASSSSDVAVHGVNAGLSLGFDIYIGHYFSIGVDATGDALFLKRPPVALPGNLTPTEQMTLLAQPGASTIYNNSGDSVGLGVAGSGHLGLHF
jgi:hypothetical protein